MSYLDNAISCWDMSTINPVDLGHKRNGNNGTGVSILSSAIVDGVASGKAMWFDGSADYVRIEDSVSLNPGAQITIAAFIKIDAIGAQRTFFSKPIIGSPWNDYALEVSVAGKPLFIVTNTAGTNVIADADAAIVAGAWYFILGAYDGANAKLYVNAVLQADQPALTGDIKNSGQRLYLGSWSTTSQPFNGTIDKPWMFCSALKQGEVTDFYRRLRIGTL